MAQTERQLAGNQRRRLRKMREQLLEMADQWEDFDEFNRGELTRVAELVEEVSAAMVVEEP